MSDKECAFCQDDRVIERHHIVPRRYDGADKEENLVDVCPTCHEVLERLYDRRFYEKINARVEDRDAYEEGVTDTLEMWFEVRIESDQTEARRRIVEELLSGYVFCPVCEHPTQAVEECEVCGTVNPTEAEGYIEGAP